MDKKLYIHPEQGILTLFCDDIDRHGEGCDCGLCNRNGKSYGVAIIPIQEPEDKWRVYGPSDDAAMHNARLECENEGAHPVDYDIETGRVSGIVPIELDKIIEADGDQFLDILSEHLAGGYLGDISYGAVGIKDGKILIAASGEISDYIREQDPDNELGLLP